MIFIFFSVLVQTFVAGKVAEEYDELPLDLVLNFQQF